MVIESKFQLRSLNLDVFAISVNTDKLQLFEHARYLGLWVQNDLCWDDHILGLCQKMYYNVHMFRRLRKIPPSQLLLNINKSYVQSKIDYLCGAVGFNHGLPCSIKTWPEGLR